MVLRAYADSALMVSCGPCREEFDPFASETGRMGRCIRAQFAEAKRIAFQCGAIHIYIHRSCELEADVRICIGIGTRDGSHAKASLCSRHGPRAAVAGTAGLQERFARILCVQLIGFQEILDVCSSEEDALCCAVPHKLNGISLEVFYCSNARQVHVTRPLESGTGASLYQGVGRR